MTSVQLSPDQQKLLCELLRVAAPLLDGYSERLTNDGRDDWKWPAGVSQATKEALMRGEFDDDDGDVDNIPNWLAARQAAEFCRRFVRFFDTGKQP